MGWWNRTWSITITSVILLLALTACGAGGSKSSVNSGTTGVLEPNVPTSKASASDAGASSAAPASESSAGTSTNSDSTVNWDRKIIRNADISMQVTSVESMLATVRTIADEAGGTVFSSSTSFDGDSQIATITLAVPSQQFDQVVNALRASPEVKKVDKESITSQDVTDQYVDLQSQLRNLQATRSRLLALMDKATQLQDILTVDKELSAIEGQIEQTTGRINYLDKHTSTSQITVSLRPFVALEAPTKKSGFDLPRAVHDAWKSSLQFTGGIATALVKVGVFLWWFWPVVVLAVVVMVIRRNRRRGNPNNAVSAS